MFPFGRVRWVAPKGSASFSLMSDPLVRATSHYFARVCLRSRRKGVREWHGAKDGSANPFQNSHSETDGLLS